MATVGLRDPFRRALGDRRPDVVFSDVHFPWTADLAAELGIPTFVFHPTGVFSLHAVEALQRHGPHKRVDGDDEAFVIEGLPHRVEMTRRELPEALHYETLLDTLRESEAKSCGVVVNTFCGLESPYTELYRMEGGRRAWYVGPVSLCTGGDAGRGGEPRCDVQQLQRWLDSRAASSVVYLCFGSLCDLGAAQLREIALGLEGCGHPFVWVVREGPASSPTPEWVPEGFEDTVEGDGLVIRGWAPQVTILGHGAVGAFVTHCGWNSVAEGVVAGRPMATWPLAGEQFLNEKLVVEVLGMGARVREGGRGGLVKGEEVARAVERVMGGGEEGAAMSRRAKEYGAKARAAMEEGGTSYEDMTDLIGELRALKRSR